MQHLIALGFFSLIPSPAAPSEQSPEHYAFVASGGVSLGSYQAGVSYVFIQSLLKRRSETPPPALSIVTGASAGNINAFLAAMTWFGERERLSATRNLFWDTWTNVGWEKLSPPEDGRAYCRRFEDPLTDDDDFPRKCCDPTTPGRCGALAKVNVFTSADGLLARKAFSAVEDNVEQLIDKAAQEGPSRGRTCAPLKLGVTLTRAAPTTEKVKDVLPVPAQRYAVPLILQPICDPDSFKLEFRNIERSWVGSKDSPGPGKKAGAGELAFLPVHCDAQGRRLQVATRRLLDVVEASSAFPVAFSPVDVATFSELKDVDCDEKASRTTRFYDGGVFDNVPLGLAIALANDSDQSHLRYFYVHPDQVRSPYKFPSDDRRRRGTAYLSRVAGNFFDEGRSYELQGIARFYRGKLNLEQHGFIATSRFFPVVGESLVAAFGAFMAQTYRIHDYLIGLYDGLFALAADEVRRERWSCVPEEPPTPPLPEEVERWQPAHWQNVACRFRDKMEQLIGEDETIAPAYAREDGISRFSIRAFLIDLLGYELQWASPLSQEDRATKKLIGAERWSEAIEKMRAGCDNPVWRVHRALRELDARGRLLARGGSREEIARFEGLRDSFDAMVHLASYGPDHQPPVGTLSWTRLFMDPKSCSDESRLAMPDTAKQEASWFDLGWSEYRGTEAFRFSTFDRLMRRASDIEAKDEESRNESRTPLKSESLPSWLFPVGRLALASMSERGDAFLELQPGTASRLLEGHPWESWVYLLPNTITFGHVQEFLWSLRMRPKLNSMFFGIDGGMWRLIPQSAGPTTFGYRLGAGIGYDPAGRLVDDLQLSFNLWREQEAGWFHAASATGRVWDSAGVEASIILATKVRLAVGLPRLWGPGVKSTLIDRLTDFQLSFGFTDLNGLALTLINTILRQEGPAEGKP